MQKRYHSGIAHRYGLYSYQLYYSASVDNIFLKYSSCFVSFSSRWDQVVSLLVQKPQNFTEQKMFQTDSRTQSGSRDMGVRPSTPCTGPAPPTTAQRLHPSTLCPPHSTPAHKSSQCTWGSAVCTVTTH